jgi:hypothetical protein
MRFRYEEGWIRPESTFEGAFLHTDFPKNQADRRREGIYFGLGHCRAHRTFCADETRMVESRAKPS